MDDRNISTNQNTSNNSSSKNRTRLDKNNTTAQNIISTKQYFKVKKRSSDNSASLQQSNSNAIDCKPTSIVTTDLPCKSADKSNLAKAKDRSYSSRNMLRNSGPTTSNDTLGSNGQSSVPHHENEELLICQNLDDLNCYTRLREDSFTYDDENKRIICLLCGKRLTDRSVDLHIMSEHHVRQFNRLEFELFHEQLSNSTLQMRTVKALCDKWYLTYSLADNLIQMRNEAISEFENILGQINPECQIRLHGSMYYGAATRDSDVNLEIIHPNSKLFETDPRSKKSIHHELIDPDAEFGSQFNQYTLHYDLASNPVETLYRIYKTVNEASRTLTAYPFTLVSDLSCLTRAVPSVTLKHRTAETTLTVNCYAERRFNLARLLRAYMLLDGRVEELSTLVKTWAKFCGIDNPDCGSYPSHAYVIMVIFFLQRIEPPVLPCLQELANKSTRPSDQSKDSKINVADGPQNEDVNNRRNNEIRDEDPEEDEEETWSASIDEGILKDLDWISKNRDPVHVLFMLFFKAMLDEFHTTSTVITIRTLKPVSCRFYTQSKPIEHPIKPAINISRCIASMKTFDFIRGCFLHTYFYLTSIPIDKSLRARKHIKNNPQDYIELYVNMSRFDFYRSMKEPAIKKTANYDPIDEMMRQKLFARDVETLYALSANDQGASLPQTLANLYDPEIMRPQNITYSYSCQLCHSSGHHKENCPKGRINKLDVLNLHDPSLDERVDLDGYFEELCKREAISHQISLVHKKILRQLQQTVNSELNRDLEFVLFGSTVNNLGSRDSDLDICVTVKDNPTGRDVDCVRILKEILQVLEKMQEVNQPSIQPIFSARVPIIRFKFYEYDIDLSMYNQCAIYNSRLLKTYSTIDPRVAPLCFLVKKFAKACEIADASKGSLSSYAWSLLVIYFLQNIDPPMLPVLQEPVKGHVGGSFGVNGWNVWFNDKPAIQTQQSYSLTSMLKGFFVFYGTFDFQSCVVSIRKRGLMTKFQKSWNGCMIAIEDPFELTYNLAKSLSDPMAIFIINSFAQIYHHITRTQKNIEAHIRDNLSTKKLADLLFNGRAITGDGPPMRGCLNCHKIGHRIKECPEENRFSKRRPHGRPKR